MAKAKTGALPGPVVKGGIPVKGKFLPPGPTTGNDICRTINLLQVIVPTAPLENKNCEELKKIKKDTSFSVSGSLLAA